MAVVGAGSMARRNHVPALVAYVDQHPGDVELYAVVDPDLEKGRALQRDFGFAASFSDLDSMVAQERPDAALVLTPYWLNGQVSAAVLEAGIHILTEKPPGMSAEQTRRLAALAAAGRLVAQIGYNRRHWPALQEGLAWMRASGQDIQYLRGTKHRTNRIHEDYAFYTSSHVIDTLLSIGGAATECYTVRQPIAGTEAYNFFSTIHFASGAVAHATGLPHLSYNQEIYEFHDLDSTVVVDMHWGTDKPACLRQYRGDELVREEIMSKGEEGSEQLRANGFLGQLECFFSALLHGTEPYPSAEDCIATSELTEAIHHGRMWRAVRTNLVEALRYE